VRIATRSVGFSKRESLDVNLCICFIVRHVTVLLTVKLQVTHEI